jgi:CHAT domain-containing protein
LRNTFFGYANSDFSYAEGSGVKRAAPQLPLPFSRIELDNIQSEFAFRRVLRNTVQSEAQLSRSLKNYKFIHFATHGIINEASPDFSKLILTNKLLDNDDLSDGHLTAAEISAMDLNADLVVLSACETGLGKIIRGEGVLGLQRAFLIAGASSVVVSLWEVFDQSTATFMDLYYARLMQNYELQMGFGEILKAYFGNYDAPLIDYKAKSMRDAKLDMLQHPYYSHPAYWAAFVYTGR